MCSRGSITHIAQKKWPDPECTLSTCNQGIQAAVQFHKILNEKDRVRPNAARSCYYPQDGHPLERDTFFLVAVHDVESHNVVFLECNLHFDETIINRPYTRFVHSQQPYKEET